MIKKLSLAIMILLYVAAGINHFINAATYRSIIPTWIPYPGFINLASGVLEIVFGILLIFPATRRLAATAIMILLVLFIPVHIYMIQEGGCMSEQLCVPAWAAWVRLVPLQFLLIFWAWWHRKL